jgi:hypothetical protein
MDLLLLRPRVIGRIELKETAPKAHVRRALARRVTDRKAITITVVTNTAGQIKTIKTAPKIQGGQPNNE